MGSRRKGIGNGGWGGYERWRLRLEGEGIDRAEIASDEDVMQRKENQGGIADAGEDE